MNFLEVLQNSPHGTMLVEEAIKTIQKSNNCSYQDVLDGLVAQNPNLLSQLVKLLSVGLIISGDVNSVEELL